jgi:hypothetical protein
MTSFNDGTIDWDKYREGFRLSTAAMPNFTANLAVEIVKHCSMVTCVEDGEDSVGRGKAKLLPAAKVAERACDIALHMTEIMEARGWMHVMPPMPKKDAEPQPTSSSG